MLLKVALNTISLDLNQTFYESTIIRGLVLQLIHNYYSVLYKYVNVSYFLDFFFPVWSKWKNKRMAAKASKLLDCGDAGPSVNQNPSKELIDDKEPFITRFSTLYNNQMFSDIVLKVGDTSYYAHKIMLVTASEVFE